MLFNLVKSKYNYKNYWISYKKRVQNMLNLVQKSIKSNKKNFID